MKILASGYKKFLTLLLGIASGGYLGYLFLTGNFHEVVPDELYRSGQLDPEQIALYQKRHGIRTVLNLRGENTGMEWYDKEIAATKKLGIKHLDFRMSAKRELSTTQALQLIDIMRTAPKPLLIHCHSGANRTGLAAALYLAGVKRRGEEISERQISLRYGHFPLWFSDSYAMDRTFEKMETALFGWPS